MTKRSVYIVPIHPYAYFRNKEYPLITGVYSITPDGLLPRLCYEVTYSDGFTDFIPISEVEKGNYKIVVEMLEEDFVS